MKHHLSEWDDEEQALPKENSQKEDINKLKETKKKYEWQLSQMKTLVWHLGFLAIGMWLIVLYKLNVIPYQNTVFLLLLLVLVKIK